jgi:hypothetical protein
MFATMPQTKKLSIPVLWNPFTCTCTPLQPDYVFGFRLLSREVPVGGCVGRGGVGPSRWVHADVSVLLDVLVHAEGAPLVEHLGAAPGHAVTIVSNFYNFYSIFLASQNNKKNSKHVC